MTETRPDAEGSLQGPARLAAAAAGLALMIPLAVASMLTPNPEGRGTHRQLGFPPCSMLVLLGRPCPTCGMTTAWSNLLRGRPIEGLRANASGVLLCLLDAAAAAWLLLSAVRGRWIGGQTWRRAAPWIVAAIAALVFIEWIWRLTRT